MAQIRMMAWNIEVYGPEKYGNWPNAAGLVTLIGKTVAGARANVFVAMELMSSVAPQICFSLKEAIEAATGTTWRAVDIPARPDGDRESYGLFWQTGAGANFNIVVDFTGQEVKNLSPIPFPNNFSDSNGRRAALATFRTTDTNTNFTVAVYHAPPNARAIQGLEALAKTINLYQVNNGGVMQEVPMRLLGGDYNLDVNIQPEYSWLTNPVPGHPPPHAGHGAGTAPITRADTHLMSMDTAIKTWGPNLARWSPRPVDYRDLQLDNIFYRATAQTGGGVIDLVAEIMNPGSAVRTVAETFTLVNPENGLPAFPNSFDLPLPLSINLNFASCAWMLARYGVSDHLPVFTVVTI